MDAEQDLQKLAGYVLAYVEDGIRGGALTQWKGKSPMPADTPASLAFVVTVDLKDRYWSQDVYCEVPATEGPAQAQAWVEQNLKTLRQYVPDADFRVTNVRAL